MLGAPRKIAQRSNEGLHLPKHERLHKGEREGVQSCLGRFWESKPLPMRLSETVEAFTNETVDIA